MLTNKEIIIGKYLSGNANPEETQKLLSWLKESEQNQSEFDATKKLWETSVKLKRDQDHDADAAWAQFETLRDSKSVTTLNQSSKNSWLKIAAAITLFAILGLVVKIVFIDAKNDIPKGISVVVPEKTKVVEPKEELATSNDSIQQDLATNDQLLNGSNLKARKRKAQKVTSKQIAMVTVLTGDSAKIFVLPDNSIVYLNAHSKLEYPENFVRSSRTVTLSGEAFFEVIDESEVFMVSCEKTLTRGAATSFNLKSQGSEKEVEVIVVSGMAEFSGLGNKEVKKLVLKSGESGTYNKERSAVIKAKHTRKNYKWWQKKSLRARIKQLFERLRNTLN